MILHYRGPGGVLHTIVVKCKHDEQPQWVGCIVCGRRCDEIVIARHDQIDTEGFICCIKCELVSHMRYKLPLQVLKAQQHISKL